MRKRNVPYESSLAFSIYTSCYLFARLVHKSLCMPLPYNLMANRVMSSKKKQKRDDCLEAMEAMEESFIEMKRRLSRLGEEEDDGTGGETSAHAETVEPSTEAMTHTGASSDALPFSPSPSAFQEHRRLFQPASRKGKQLKKPTGRGRGRKGKSMVSAAAPGKKVWGHRFVCLRSKHAYRAPRGEERDILKNLGLGDKRVSVPRNATEAELSAALLAAFPLLCDAGGFTLMVTDSQNRSNSRIVPLRQPYHVANIREQIDYHIIYVRPLQRSIGTRVDMRRSDNSDDEAVHACKSCGVTMTMASLKDHVVNCGKEEE